MNDTGLLVRAAVMLDAVAMSDILKEIVIETRQDRVCDPDHIHAFYIAHPDQLSCLVAVD